MKRLKEISPSGLLRLLLGLWWIVNLLQAGLTELANDEAYYYIFSLRPAWGYFDHPPVTAWLVWLGRQLFGDSAFGVRFFFTLLQPLYLYMLFRVIRPADYTRAEAGLFVMACAALPILQLYGFIAVPDGPLLFASALFLLCYKLFTERDNLWTALAVGASVAMLAYCKYHGALIVLFTLASNPKLFKNPKLYIAGITAAILILPHIMWQYDHDWASFRYHLAGRNKPFTPGYIVEYLLNILAVFNPLFWPLYVKAWRKLKGRNPAERAIYCICAGLIVFFLLSSIRGYVQPQWTIVSAFGFILLLFNYLRKHPRSRRYAFTVGWVTLALVGLFRIEMAFNPLGIKFEIFDNKESYQAIARLAAGRPVVFGGNYAIASKYIYYTGGEAYCQPSITYRTSQWQFIDSDTPMAGREVLAEVGVKGIPMPEGTQSAELANGMRFAYTVVDDFHPVRRISVELLEELPGKVARGQKINIIVRITNPYPYDVALDPDGKVAIAMVWGRKLSRDYERYVFPDAFMVLSPGEMREASLDFTIPRNLAPGEYNAGFVISNPPLGSWFNSPVSKIKVE